MWSSKKQAHFDILGHYMTDNSFILKSHVHCYLLLSDIVVYEPEQIAASENRWNNAHEHSASNLGEAALR